MIKTKKNCLNPTHTGFLSMKIQTNTNQSPLVLSSPEDTKLHFFWTDQTNGSRLGRILEKFPSQENQRLSRAGRNSRACRHSWLEAALLPCAQKVTVFVKILSLQPLGSRDLHLSGAQWFSVFEKNTIKGEKKVLRNNYVGLVSFLLSFWWLCLWTKQKILLTEAKFIFILFFIHA